MKNKELSAIPQNSFYNLNQKHGMFSTTNQTSYFAKKINTTIDTFSYDISNQRALASLDVYGEIKQLTFFQGNFLVEQKPGVWVHKKFTTTPNLHFAITINQQKISLNNKNHELKTDLILDALPRFVHQFTNCQITLIPFCPIIQDNRYGMVVYQVTVKNTSSKPLTINQFEFPRYQKKYSDQFNVIVDQNTDFQNPVLPQQQIDFAIALIDPNSYLEMTIFDHANSQNWLKETLSYYQKIFGQLELPDHQLTHLLHRAIYQSLGAFGADSHGNSVGSHWGTYPATAQIWHKDMFYSTLTSIFFDPKLCQQQILWFTKYGVRFKSQKFKGGIEHSLSNSVASIVLSGLYYEWTNDLSFFQKHPLVLQKARQIIDHEVNQVRPGEPMLFHSTWISDAYSLGKYHTGSNICFWKACQALANIYKGFSQKQLSQYYGDLAKTIKEAILQNLTFKGPFGEQFLEGLGDQQKDYYAVSHYQKPILDQGLIFLSDVIKAGQIDLKMHDGEESDTTLIPFYGFLSREDAYYQNSMKFAASSANPTFGSDIKGIRWGQKSGATFPGFITVLMGNFTNPKALQDQLKELLHLADLDGSWWWWPYRLNGKVGDVYRDVGCGKCGWASGTFVSLFITQYLGIQINNNLLTIKPLKEVNYNWQQVHLGNLFFNLQVTPQQIKVKNLATNAFSIQLASGQQQKLTPQQEIIFKRKKE